jgi:hypothetical protein
LTINGVKKHVGVLERADLVVTEKVGRARHCRLASGSLAEATAWIEEHRRALGEPPRSLRALRRADLRRRGVSLDLRFERLIAAAPERVFDAFTDPIGQREFYGQDAAGWIVDSHCDLRVGGVSSVSFGRRPTSCTTTATCSR